ncbi:hypothetical protein [Geobacter sulfurreducens]|uniref:hypothetical protein n=1 Tax=Geobacter sulfurreducens TaxID=35554 RepID=UPI0001D8F382|nr:hypothetical protein [Geobacter sulfurreducens]
MSPHHTPLHPCFDPAETSNELSRLLVSGPIVDADLDRRIARLRERFRIYCGIYPFGMWDSGLVVTREMRALTDLLLPLAEILPAFSRLFRLTLRFPPLLEATPLTTACSWLDLLERLDVSAARGNPARLLEQLAGDGARRTSFVFSLFIPPPLRWRLRPLPGPDRLSEAMDKTAGHPGRGYLLRARCCLRLR